MNRLNELLKSDRHLFHTQDLATIWKISNPNTLYTIITRYTQKGILTRLYKGFYTTKDPNLLDQLEVGAAACQTYTYLSTETVLVKTGIIMQFLYANTFISSKSYRIDLDQFNFHFSYRRLTDKFLYNQIGITRENGIFIASTERAVADLRYFAPNYFFDSHEFIDWKKVEQIQKEIGYL